MNQQNLEEWEHNHVFGQDKKRTGETRLLIVVGLTLVMMVWEILAGILFGSMALLADGLHMGSHAVALGIAVFAYAYARQNAGNRKFSFGTGKVNALGGFAGAILLAIFALYMVIESIDRFMHPIAISFNGAIVVAVIGLAVNGWSAWILSRDDHDHTHTHADHNHRAAYFHVLADAMTSFLAIAALLAGKYAGWGWMDPVMGIVGALLITRWSWYLLKDTSSVLLDQQHTDLEQIVMQSLEDDNIRICDLHLWAIGPDIYAAIVAIVSHSPESPVFYRERLQARCPSLVHVTVELHPCTNN